jgi:single-strand DNA-binding protein
MSINRVTLDGNLTRDPEVRTFGNGGKVANISVATSERWRDKTSGEWKEKTEFHRVALFDEKTVDMAEQHLKKGSRVYLEGALQTRKYTDKSGDEKSITEVVLQGFRGVLIPAIDTRAPASGEARQGGWDAAPARPSGGGGGTSHGYISGGGTGSANGGGGPNPPTTRHRASNAPKNFPTGGGDLNDEIPF